MEKHIVPLYRLELVREKDLPYKKISDIEDAAQVFHEMLDSSPTEKLAVIYTNTSNQMIGAEYVGMGSITSVHAASAEVFRGALVAGASDIWVAHNHVDGVVTPSPQDYEFTFGAIDMSKLLGIVLRDHLVIGPGSHYSIRTHQAEFQARLREFDKKMLMKLFPLPPQY